MKSIFKKGFTLFEVMIIIAIFFILSFLVVFNLRFFQKEADLENSAEKIINLLRLAQNKTLASEKGSQWGIFFDSSASPHKCILFKGENYFQRDSSFDEIYELPKSIEFLEINFDGKNEIVFERITGFVSNLSQRGKISIGLKNDLSKKIEIFIESSGTFSLETQSNPSDSNRIKDSRHVHFNYSREISLLTEKLILTFFLNGFSITKEIPISDNIKEGQFYWNGEVNVEGNLQKLEIHTHFLNDSSFGTQFCIHRNRIYNNSALKVQLTDDSGDLIYYDENGQTIKGNSIYVSDPIWQ